MAPRDFTKGWVELFTIKLPDDYQAYIDPDTTLQEAVEAAIKLSMRFRRVQPRIFPFSDPTKPVPAVTSKNFAPRQEKSAKSTGGGGGTRQARETPEGRRCKFCLFTNHATDDCNRLEALMQVRGKATEENKPNQVYVVSSLEDASALPYGTVALESPEGWRSMAGFLDSGATISLIRKDFANKLKLPIKTKRVTIRVLSAPQESTIISTEFISPMFQLLGRKKQVDLAIVASLDIPLICGRNVFDAFSIWVGRDECQPGRWLAMANNREPFPTLLSGEADETNKRFFQDPEEVEEAILRPMPEVKICETLSPEQVALIKLLLYEFAEVFAREGGTAYWSKATVEHEIPTKTNQYPRYHARPISERSRTIVEEQANEWMKDGKIEPCSSTNPIINHPVIVHKESGAKPRVCFDFTRLNAITERVPHPAKHLDTVRRSFFGVKWVTKMDLASGYHQVPLAKQDRHKTAFLTERGPMQFTCMPFGLCGAGDTMQKVMDAALREVRDITSNYMDDTWIITRTEDLERHLRDVRRVFQQLRIHGLFLNAKKTQIAYRQIDALGHSVSEAGTQIPDTRVKALLELERPRRQRDVSKVLGAFGFYSAYIKDYAAITTPLTDLLKKENAWEWTEKQQAAFDQLKQAMTSADALHLPDTSKPYILQTDASAVAVGAVLSQVVDGRHKPVAYFSKKLKPAQRSYASYDLEALAVVEALKHFHLLLDGATFTLETDNIALSHILGSTKKKDNVKAQHARWRFFIESFRPFTVRHRSGTDLPMPDLLSRAPGFPESEEGTVMDEEEIAACWAIQLSVEPDPILEAQQNDPEWSLIRSVVLKDSPASILPPTLKKRYNKLKEYLHIDPQGRLVHIDYAGGKMAPRSRIRFVIPESLRETLLIETHSSPLAGHRGYHKTYQEVAEKYFWPNLFDAVKQYCAACEKCARTKSSNTPPAKLHPHTASRPWQRVAVDFIGPLPPSSQGHLYILTFVDVFTGWPCAYPTFDATADTLLQQALSFISAHDPPEEFLFDNAQAFAANTVAEFTKAINSSRLFTPTYHPQSNPAERLNQTLAKTMRAIVEKHEDWHLYVPIALRAIRTSRNERTGYSPYFLLYGRDPVSPIDIAWGTTPEAPADLADYAVQLMRSIRSGSDTALHNSTVARQKAAEALNEAPDPPQLSEGDWVMVKKPEGSTTKFDERFTGPYEVVATNDMGEVQLHMSPDIDEWHPIGRIKKTAVRGTVVDDDSSPDLPDGTSVSPPPPPPPPQPKSASRRKSMQVQPPPPPEDPTGATIAVDPGPLTIRDGPNLVNRRVLVYWPQEDTWYPGTITKWITTSNNHEVEYENEFTVSRHNFVDARRVRDIWRLIAPKPISFSEGGSVAENPRAAPP